jgi:ATP-dependent DNA helicase DinG
VATQYFGVGVSTYRIEDLAQDVERLGLPDTAKAVEKLRDRGRMFFNEIAYAHRADGRARGEERTRATPSSLAQASEGAAMLAGALDIVEATLKLVRLKPDTTDTSPDLTEQIEALARRAGEIRNDVRFLMRADEAEYVYFVEFRGRGVFLRASPIDVSAIVRELLLDKMRTTVLTSATLTVDGSFEYIKNRLGIRRSDEVRLPSEFDFERQALLYLPRTMPDLRSPDSRGRPAGGDRDPQANARPRLRALHQLRDAACRASHCRNGARLPDLRPGHDATHAAVEAVSRNAAFRPPCDIQLRQGVDASATP